MVGPVELRRRRQTAREPLGAQRRWLIAFAAFAAGLGWAHAAPYRLEPFKDELFQYQTILQTEYGGDFLLVDYDRNRDLKQRDVIERQKVKPEYVSLETEAAQTDVVLRSGNARIRYTAVGASDGGARAIVIFLHGRGTDRSAGASDWIHGGNFNRIKNLMMRNGGVYISADFSDFGRRGTTEMKALVIDQANRSPGAPIFLACGSWGGKICWRLIADSDTAPLIKGVLFLDSEMDTDFIARAAKLPPGQRPAIHISNTMEDWIVGYKSQLGFFRRMKKEVPDYPIRFVLFDSGTHGISLRMTDWRQVLNWMLEMQEG
ncbi:MAG TPA: alpha/beta fold hydrolase [Bauldia sp.]|nr:alpha/beta fold hydrolase [Bauldia sp.]